MFRHCLNLQTFKNGYSQRQCRYDATIWFLMILALLSQILSLKFMRLSANLLRLKRGLCKRFFPILDVCWQACLYQCLPNIGKVSKTTTWDLFHPTMMNSTFNISSEWNCLKIMTLGTYLIFVIFLYFTFWGLKILHSKVRKFATKIASQQNSVNHHSRAKLHTVCKITHRV